MLIEGSNLLINFSLRLNLKLSPTLSHSLSNSPHFHFSEPIRDKTLRAIPPIMG